MRQAQIYLLLVYALTGCVTTSPTSKVYANWQSLPTHAPLGPLALHQCFSYSHKGIVFGGIRDDGDFDPFTNTGALFDLTKQRWQSLPQANAPSPRQHAKVATAHKALIHFGGFDRDGHYPQRAAKLNLAKLKWEPLPLPPIHGRAHHSLTVVGHRVVIFGGKAKQKRLNWGYLDLKTNRWTAHSLPKSVANRVSHVSVGYKGQLFIWGGFTGGKRVNTGHLVDLKEPHWQPLAKPSPLTPRANARFARLGSRVYIWGGATQDGNANTGAVFDLANRSWKRMPAIPDHRYRHLRNASLTAINDHQILLWGGRFGNKAYTNAGWLYDTQKDRWQKLNQANPPPGRMHHCLTRVGSGLLLYGGIGVKDRNHHHYQRPWQLSLETRGHNPLISPTE